MAKLSQVLEEMDSDTPTTAEAVLHNVLKVAVVMTGRGKIGDDYTKTVEFPIGDETIVFDSYYQKIRIDTDDEEEIEGTVRIEKLSKEITKRLVSWFNSTSL